MLTKIAPLVQRAAADTGWQREDMYPADPELGFGSTLLHAKRYIEKLDLKAQGIRISPERDSQGSKTENCIVELDCLTPDYEQHVVLLVVWVFGVLRKIESDIVIQSR